MATKTSNQAIEAQSSNYRSNFCLRMSKVEFDVLVSATKKRYCAQKIAKELNISKSTVNYHLKKLLNLRLIKLINQGDKVKFYEPTVSYKVTPVQKDRAFILRSNNPGHESNFGILQSDVRTNHISLINGGKKEITGRVHHAAFKVPIIDKFKYMVNDIEWDQKKTPNNKFTQYVKRTMVPDVGQVTFMWNHSKQKDTLITYLPVLYLFPHELDNIDTVLDEYLWKALKFFAKRFHVGVERIPEKVGKYHIAFPPKQDQTDFLKQHGTLTVKTKNGEAYVDDSEKTGNGEVEFTHSGEAKAYAELQDGLLQPGEFIEMQGRIQTMHGQIQGLDNGAAALSKSVTVIQQHQQETENFLQAFTKNFEKFLQADEKKWEAQKEFNEIMKEYIQTNDKKLGWILRKTGIGNIPTKQQTLDTFSQKEEKTDEGDKMYG